MAEQTRKPRGGDGGFTAPDPDASPQGGTFSGPDAVEQADAASPGFEERFAEQHAGDPAAFPAPGSSPGPTETFTPFTQTAGRYSWAGGALGPVGRDIFASSFGIRVASYTFDTTSVAADANGRKFVRRGTVLSTYPPTTYNKVGPRVTAYPVGFGVLVEDIDATNGDVDCGVVLAGALNTTRLWDNGVFGSVAARVLTDCPFIQFSAFDF